MPDDNDPAAAYSNQDPDPATQPGVPASPPPGDIPADSGQMSGAAGGAYNQPNVGPVSGNRTPMFITLGVLAFFVLAIAVITGASFFPSD
jgi:hypothetical protein